MPPRLAPSILPSRFLTPSSPTPTSTANTASIRAFSQTCPTQLRRLPRWRRTKLSVPEMREYMDWLSSDGQQYRAAGEQPNYLLLQRRGRGRDGGAAADATAEAEKADAGEEPVSVSGKAARRRDGRRARGVERNFYSPFPLNPYFKSHPVLSETAREAIYDAVVGKGQGVREVSTNFKVTMERIAAVVRMKQMERDWLEEGKKVVPYFSEKVLKMIPQTPYSPGTRIEHHESINDLPVHSSTTQQIFWPASESREFTRIDAGKVFKPDLLPADMRIPHPQQVDAQAALLNSTRSLAMERIREGLEKRFNDDEARRQRKVDNDRTIVAQGKRFDFRISEINADWVGKDGRSRKGVGFRYGMPHEDRKRGLIKVPTRVD